MKNNINQSILGSLAISLLLACILVFGVYNQRQSGMSSDTKAYIPMRQMTPDEVSALYYKHTTQPGSATSISFSPTERETILVKTRNYPIGPNQIGPDTLARKTAAVYTFPKAASGNLLSVYEVSKNQLEIALGRKLNDKDWGGDTTSSVAFDASKISFYVAIEIIFITLWVGILLLALKQIGSIWGWLPILWCGLWLPILFVPSYSPGFIGDNLYYQRIVLEEVWLWSSVGIFVLALPSLISFLFYLLLRPTSVHPAAA